MERSELLRSCVTILNNMDEWIEKFCEDKEIEEELKEQRSILSREYNIVRSELYSVSPLSKKPMNSMSAAAFGDAIGGTALGVASYLNAEAKNMKYQEELKAFEKQSISLDSKFNMLQKRHNEVMTLLQKLPKWVEDQEKITKAQEETEEEFAYKKTVFITTEIIIAVVIGIVSTIIVRIFTEYFSFIVGTILFSFLGFCIVQLFCIFFLEDKTRAYYQKRIK